MKKILITGKNSYIGMSLDKWLNSSQGEYQIEILDLKKEEWKSASFESYHTIVHLAGIAHVSSDPKLKDLYLKINRDLAIEVARKAKNDGVRQFIFMSSMIIFGDDANFATKKIITKTTTPKTNNLYGISKLEADFEIQKMTNDAFKTAIIRTPMVYGPGCKGNFPKLKKLSKYCVVFPDIDNQRSMIYIDNLCESIKQIIDKRADGIFYPQNSEYVSTKKVIEEFRKLNNQKTIFVGMFNPVIKLLSNRLGIINKVFGNRVYDMDLSRPLDDNEYAIVDFKESIKRCR